MLRQQLAASQSAQVELNASMSLIEQLKEEIARRNREEGQIERAKNEIKELYELLQTVTTQKE